MSAVTPPTSASSALQSSSASVVEPKFASDSALIALHFEAVYREAEGDASRIPWADAKPNPSLVSWLNAEAAGRLRPGARAIVVGCGLGDDVIELINRGFDASGFDIAPTAIDWARKRFPTHAEAFFVGDLLDMPSRTRHRFDLVIEAYTIQSAKPTLRHPFVRAIAQLACPRGLMLTIARGRDEHEPLEHLQGPPYPLAPSELLNLFASEGWQPTRAIDNYFDEESPPQHRLRACFVRA